jgi:hypothetical protein
MATLNNVRDLLCAEFGFKPDNVGWMMRSLRDVGLLPKGKGGKNAVNAPIAAPADCITIMLGSLASEGAVEAAANAVGFSWLPFNMEIDRVWGVKTVGGRPVLGWFSEPVMDDLFARKMRDRPFGFFLADIVSEIRNGQGDGSKWLKIELMHIGEERSAKIVALTQDGPLLHREGDEGKLRTEKEFYFGGRGARPETGDRLQPAARELLDSRVQSLARVTVIPGSILMAFANLLDAPDAITLRDAEIWRLCGEGLGVTEIARRTTLSRPTVHKVLSKASMAPDKQRVAAKGAGDARLLAVDRGMAPASVGPLGR